MATVIHFPFRSRVAEAARLSGVTAARGEVRRLEFRHLAGHPVRAALEWARRKLERAQQEADERRMLPRSAEVVDLDEWREHESSGSLI